jgi:hypothetical protein
MVYPGDFIEKDPEILGGTPGVSWNSSPHPNDARLLIRRRNAGGISGRISHRLARAGPSGTGGSETAFTRTALNANSHR